MVSCRNVPTRLPLVELELCCPPMPTVELGWCHFPHIMPWGLLLVFVLVWPFLLCFSFGEPLISLESFGLQKPLFISVDLIIELLVVTIYSYDRRKFSSTPRWAPNDLTRFCVSQLDISCLSPSLYVYELLYWWWGWVPEKGLRHSSQYVSQERSWNSMLPTFF